MNTPVFAAAPRSTAVLFMYTLVLLTGLSKDKTKQPSNSSYTTVFMDFSTVSNPEPEQ